MGLGRQRAFSYLQNLPRRGIVMFPSEKLVMPRVIKPLDER